MLLVQGVFTKTAGAPATGESLTDFVIYLYSRAKANGAVATVWNGVNPTEEVGAGVYTRAYSTADVLTYDYFGYMEYTGATVLDCNYAIMAASAVDAEAVWSYGVRTITLTAAQLAAILAGTSLTVHRGDSLSQAIEGVGDISSRVKMWFTVKRRLSDPDSAAIIQITEADGLTVLNGAAVEVGNAGNGDLTVTDAVAGDILLELLPAASGVLLPQSGLYWDVQIKDGSGDIWTKARGSFAVQADVTRALT